MAWAVWLVVMHIPMLKHEAHHRLFRNWLKDHQPPGFIPPRPGGR